MLKIGITGGIGSGKSIVCKIFKMLNIPVFDADTEAKKFYIEDLVFKQQITALFGQSIYDEQGFNRKKMAEIIFNSSEKLKQLTNILHPLVQDKFEHWIQQQQSSYVIKEAALLIESGSYKNLDGIIYVSAPLKLRIQRVMKRDQISQEEVQQRINKQMPEDEKKSFCQFEIKNDEKHLIIPQVLSLHNQLLKLRV